MKLTVSCQKCGKILSVVEKDQISNDDIAMYQSNAFCDTVQGIVDVEDEEGNITPTTVYDAQDSILATKTV